MSDKKPTNSSRWQKGCPSPNSNGRPLGSKNRAMTDKQVMDFLGKRTEHYLNQIEKLAKETDNDQLKFKCYNGLVNFDFQLRASEYKKWLDRENLKIKRGEISPTETQDKEDNTPIISLTAISGKDK